MKNMTDVNQRNIGVVFNVDGKAKISVWIPNAISASLQINRNTLVNLHKHEHGYWMADTDLLKPGDFYQFKFTVNENGSVKEIYRADPAGVWMNNGVHEDSMAVDLNAFEFTDHQWSGLALEDLIFYELHVGTFTAEGTISAIEEKLDHLIELGITAIELMPVAQFAGHHNWGYDGVYPFAVHREYGTPDSLQKLVNTCHKKGLAVILDVVYNHIGPEGNYFKDFGPYFTDKYKTPWGDAINFDDAGCDGVRQFYIENALMWLRDFHVDGLRLDAVHAIKDFSAKHFLVSLKEHVNKLSEVTGRKYHLIAECDLNDSRYISSIDSKGYGMDAQWVDEFHHALRVTCGQEKKGYYADFNGIEHLAKSFNDVYVYDGLFSVERNRFFGNKVTTSCGNQFVVFAQNHDQVGNRMFGERLGTLLSFELQKLVAATVLVSPYLPLLFMGEEWGETQPFQFFVNYNDKNLIEAVRKGRKSEFSAFHDDSEPPDPQDSETFNRSKLSWDSLDKVPHQTMLSYYKKLLKIRKELPALHQLNRRHLKTYVYPEDNCLVVHRWHETQHVLCMMNFSSEPKEIPIPDAKLPWKIILDSSDAEWQGKNNSEAIKLQDKGVLVRPESIQIYTHSHVHTNFNLSHPIP
jgi:maltooligosyltrehalose trehalohydrolase